MRSNSFNFNKSLDIENLAPLIQAWKKSLLAPEDGMWEVLTGYAQHWEVKTGNELIGYACVDDEERLLQFFLLPFWIQDGAEILQQFLNQANVQKGLIGTNNPIALSIAMQVQKSVVVDTCLFTDHLAIENSEQKGVFRSYGTDDPERLVDFYHGSMDGPKDWLRGYLGDLLTKGEIFILEDEAEILGACEVRKSASQTEIADLGMVVSAAHRRKGLGTFLLGKAKEVALSWDRQPICSCEKDNIGSLKSIQNNGFRSIHQMLLLEF